MGRARRLAWEPESVPSDLHGSQPSSTLVGQVLHHLVQEEHLGPTVAVLEDPRQRQLAPETRGGPASRLEPIQELPETPVLARRLVSPASAPAELEDVPAVASASEPGPEREPHEPTAEPNRPSRSRRMGRARHVTWQDEQLGPTLSELEDPRQTQLAPETKGRLASWLQRVQALFQTPVRELRPLSSASAPAELEDIPAEASALRQGPKLEPQEPSGLVRRATAVMVPGLTEPEPCPDPMSPWDIPGVVSAPVPGPELEPHEPLVPGPVAPAGMAPGLAEPEADPEPTRACVAITRHVWRKEEWTILAFPHGLVAEQLTLICAGLYDRMDFAEFNSYLRNQPQMGDIERLALTTYRTYRVLREFDALVKLVTTTCLGTPSMMASDRAEVVRFWIWVAMGSLNLRNYTALHAIVLALQSPAIHRLESTWGHVSCVCLMVYEDLKTQDNWVHRKRLFKELESILRARQRGRMGPEERRTKDVVPYLGLILDDSIDKHLEYEDFPVIQSEITMQRKLAKVYDLEPDERFRCFAQAVEPLDEEESYSLSCQLEPPGQGAGRK